MTANLLRSGRWGTLSNTLIIFFKKCRNFLASVKSMGTVMSHGQYSSSIDFRVVKPHCWSEMGECNNRWSEVRYLYNVAN